MSASVIESKYCFEPANTKQKRFMESTAQELLLSGAAGAGKTRIGCERVYMFAQIYPGSKVLICRQVNNTLKKTTIATLLREVVPPQHVVHHNKSEQYIIVRTSDPDIFSEIHYCGLDKGAEQDYPTKIMSTEWTYIFVDETIEVPEEAWEALITRLRFNNPNMTPDQNNRTPRGICGATNPDGPFHWLHRRFFDDKVLADGTEITTDHREVILTTPYDNPHVNPTYIKNMEQTLTGLRRKRLLFGQWVQAEGAIFENFDRDKHTITDADLLAPQDYKEFIVGADSNYPGPRAAVLIGVRGDGRRDIIDEFYVEKAPVEQLKDWLVKWQARLRRNLVVYHDPSAPEVIMRLQATGVSCVKAVNSVNEGIDSVNSYIDRDMLRVHARCKGLMKEMATYVWKKSTKTLEKEPDKTKPDHACDALRYALHSHVKRNYKPVFTAW